MPGFNEPYDWARPQLSPFDLTWNQRLLACNLSVPSTCFHWTTLKLLFVSKGGFISALSFGFNITANSVDAESFCEPMGVDLKECDRPLSSYEIAMTVLAAIASSVVCVGLFGLVTYRCRLKNRLSCESIHFRLSCC